MKLIYLKSALKCNFFDVAIDIKIQFFRVLVTIEPGRSLLQFVTTNCLIRVYLKEILTGAKIGVLKTSSQGVIPFPNKVHILCSTSLRTKI